MGDVHFKAVTIAVVTAGEREAGRTGHAHVHAICVLGYALGPLPRVTDLSVPVTQHGRDLVKRRSHLVHRDDAGAVAWTGDWVPTTVGDLHEPSWRLDHHQQGIGVGR